MLLLRPWPESRPCYQALGSLPVELLRPWEIPRHYQKAMLNWNSVLQLALNATLLFSPDLQFVLKPVESADAIQKRQSAQPFNNDYNGPSFSSPPSYPSPWGSGAGDWAAAYEKARAFVSQLTLLEKVNLTTGVG